MNFLSTARFWALYLTVFTLPMFMRINNYLLGVFVVISLAEALLRRRGSTLRLNIDKSWPVLAFFLLAVLACLRSWDLVGFKDLERFWAFFWLPIVFFSNPEAFAGRKRGIFLALTYGCIATLLICYGNVFRQMYLNEESLYDLYKWKYVGSRFTEIADTHPAYLGLFSLTAVVFLLRDNMLTRTDKFFHIIFLMVGLFQLAGRTTILLFLALFVLLLFRRIRSFKWQIPVLTAGILLITIGFMNYGGSYMGRRILSPETYLNENRMERWKVSYDIFREYPLFGAGYKQVRIMRRELYAERNLPYGQTGDFNAHNQLLEYLSTNGVIGGFVYAVCLMFLILSSLYNRNLLFVYIFAAFLIANMTESMLVRIKGIEYFAIFACVFLCDSNFLGRETRSISASAAA